MANQVIVVGGGLAGLSAAHTVLERGGRVVVIDKNPFLGGNSTKATSGINGALTRTQVKLGIQDSYEAFERDTALSATGGKDATPYPLATVLTKNSAPAVEWLIEAFGLDLSLTGRLGGHSFPRTHRGTERFPGMTITYALMEKLEEIEKSGSGAARVITKARVVRIITNAQGEVTGVEYEKDGQKFTENGVVIIASGGYGADFTQNSLLAKHRPDLMNLPTTNGDHCTGDGIKMAEEVGAATCDMEIVQVHPTSLVKPDDPEAKVKFLAAEALRGCGGIIIDRHGKRFCDELGRRDYVTGEMNKNDGPFRLLLNSGASKEIEWHCKHYVGRGLMRKFNNGRDLAKEMGIDAAVLDKTLKDYNGFAKTKTDPFGKKFFPNLPVEIDDWFHVAFITPAVHYCLGGLSIDTESAVLRKDGKPLPGMWATGEVAGGVHGANRLGGSSLLDCVVFGRVSGASATKYLLSRAEAAGQADARLAKVVSHIGPETAGPNAITATVEQRGVETRVTVDPDQKQFSMNVRWSENDGAAAGCPVASSASTSASAPSGGNAAGSASTGGATAAPAAPAAREKKEYTAEEVAKHNTEQDCWVIVNGEVLDVTGFLQDHPGGAQAILLFAGKDATEEFNMLHDKGVVEKYAPECIIGTLKGGAEGGAAHGGAETAGATAAGGVNRVTGLASLSLTTPPTASPSATESAVSGGTADILPNERKKTTINTEKLMNFLDGGKKKTARRRFILSPGEGTDLKNKYNWSRNDYLAEHVQHFAGIHMKYLGKMQVTREDILWMAENTMLSGTLMNHFGLFCPTISGMASEEQHGRWLEAASRMKLVGCYAQTELGHGSNVRGLQTTATYDKSTQEFVLNTPTLKSMKWWPGTLGKVATHAAVYAQLLIDGKEYGVHVFMVQIRDENHRPLPGIELGDLGNKLGDHANDTGYMRMDNIRIPRENMFAKYQQVQPDGTYVKSQNKTNDKLHYATMMFTRGGMVKQAGGYLARAVTIAMRYSLVRTQGFKQNKKGQSYLSEERQILDHQIQGYRVFLQLGMTYAIKFTGQWMIDRFADLEGGGKLGQITDTAALPEIAATSAGLKALCTFWCANGIEDCRKCCGGNGYLLNSGVAQLAADYVWQTTAEGDFVVLSMLTSRFLLKSLTKALNGKPLAGPVAYLRGLKDLASTPPPRPTKVEDMYDLDFLQKLFHYRALVTVANVGQDFQAKVASGMTFDEAWNLSSIELNNATRNHCTAFMVDNFILACQSADKADAAIGKALRQLCSFYACTQVLEYQWADVLDAKSLKIVKEAAYSLLAAMRPNAIAYVDAFDIPDRVLNSTLGSYDGNVYERLYEHAKTSTLNRQDPFIGYEETLRPHLDLELLKQGNKKPSKL